VEGFVQQGQPSPPVGWEAVAVRCRLANLLRERGRGAEARPLYQEARTILQKAADDHPDTPEIRGRLAYCSLNQGVLRMATGQLTEAEQDFRTALALLARVLAERPEAAEEGYNAASAHNNLAVLLQRAGRMQEALA